MMHYMANAGGDFASVDKFKLKWNKIDQLGLIDPDHSWNTSANQPAGYYAADRLIMQGGRWDFQIPEAIGPANYILRAETIAIHSSMIKDGTQHYPQCINIEVTEGGSDYLYGGVIGTELYKPTDPGIGDFNIFVTNPIYSNYPIPGPPIHECGQKGYDQTPHFGSAPKWHGPDTAEPYGLNSDSYPVGKIGVDAPNGPTYGKSPAATTTTGATTAATTTAPATDEYSMTTSAPAIITSAGSIPTANAHSSWTSHQFMGTNATATATGTYPTGTAVPVYGAPVDNSGNHNTGGNTNHPSSSSHPGSSYTDSGNTNGNTPSSTTGGADNHSSGSTTDSGHHGTTGDNTDTPNSATATGGNQPTSGSNPTSYNDNSGSDNHSTSSPTSNNGNSGSDNHPTTSGSYTSPHSSTSSGTSPHSFVDNNNHETCPEPTPAKIDSSATPTDDSTVGQLLDIIDLCLKKLKAKLANKVRRHARDILRTRV